MDRANTGAVPPPDAQDLARRAAPDDHLAAGLGALVHLFCARFMPGVEPPDPTARVALARPPAPAQPAAAAAGSPTA